MSMKGGVNYPALASLYLAVASFISWILFCLFSNQWLWPLFQLVWLLAFVCSLLGLALGSKKLALRGSRAANWAFGLTLAGVAVNLLGGGVQVQRYAATLVVLQGKLTQLAVAMHTYHEARGQFPPSAFCDKDGRPLLSWRVLLLPYVDEGDLYQQFNLNEPWDSPHNLGLQEKMPPIYVLPDGFRPPAEPYATFFQVFTGPGAAFEGCKGMNFKEDFPDGISNTLLIVTSEKAVPWTKPADLDYAPGRPLPVLGVRLRFGTPHLFANTAWVGLAFADGHARCIAPERVTQKSLRAWISRNGNDSPDPDELR
jgi:hypothetical protein